MLSRLKIIFTVMLVPAFIAGCGKSPAQSTLVSSPTLMPATALTTVESISTVAPTSESTASPTQTVQITDLPPVVIEQPTRQITPVPDEVPDKRKYPPALVQIIKPGPNSSLVSPIYVQADVYPGDQGLVTVQLIGEDGRVMAEKLLKFEFPASGGIQMVTSIPFEIRAAGEAALLVVSTRDGYGRRISQSAVPLVLLQIGKSEIENPGFLKEPFILTVPKYGDSAKKGIVHVEGLAHPFNGNPIVGELVSQTGGILKSVFVVLPTTAPGQDYVPFKMDIPFSVNSRTPVRLILRQMDERLPQVDIALNSTIVSLEP